jgi:hypothetical protein
MVILNMIGRLIESAKHNRMIVFEKFYSEPGFVSLIRISYGFDGY